MSIKIKIYDDIKYLTKKPEGYKKFLEKINKLFNIDNSSNLFFEYSTSEDKYYKLDIQSYAKFFICDDIMVIYGYTDKTELQSYTNQYEEEEVEDLENNNPQFYEDNKEIEDTQKVKEYIISSQKEKIRKSRINMEESENKNISNDNLNNDNEINNLMNEHFEKFKDELIYETGEKLSQIVMESKIQVKNSNCDEIKTPSSVETHSGIVCSGCGVCPIQGIRYKCVYCQVFDYCEDCHQKKSQIHRHPFYKLKFVIN